MSVQLIERLIVNIHEFAGLRSREPPLEHKLMLLQLVCIEEIVAIIIKGCDRTTPCPYLSILHRRVIELANDLQIAQYAWAALGVLGLFLLSEGVPLLKLSTSRPLL